jgi:hypothetical protein
MLLAVLALAAGAGAAADEVTPFDGNWSASFPRKSGGEGHGRLILKGDLGSWRYVSNQGHQANRYPCLNLDFPITIEERSAERLRLKVDADKTMHGCQDLHLTLQPVDAGHLQGRFGDGSVLQLNRE